MVVRRDGRCRGTPPEVTPGLGKGWRAGRAREAPELSQTQVAELSSIRLDLAASFSQQSQPGEAAGGGFSPRFALYFHWQEGVNSPPHTYTLAPTHPPGQISHCVQVSRKKGGGNGEQRND